MILRITLLLAIIMFSAAFISPSRTLMRSTAQQRRFFSRPLASLSSPPSPDDTIYALSTGAAGAAGVAVVRISGSNAQIALGALISSATSAIDPSYSQDMPKPRRAALRKLYDPTSGELLDEAIVILFPGPNSFTGEDVVELQTHGSRAVISGVLGALADLHQAPGGPTNSTEGETNGVTQDDEDGEIHENRWPRLRPADRGEFTQRAFANGRLGLTEVEGLADLLGADTAAQRRQALQQMGGATERAFNRWRAVLAKCLAHSEVRHTILGAPVVSLIPV